MHRPKKLCLNLAIAVNYQILFLGVSDDQIKRQVKSQVEDDLIWTTRRIRYSTGINPSRNRYFAARKLQFQQHVKSLDKYASALLPNWYTTIQETISSFDPNF